MTLERSWAAILADAAFNPELTSMAMPDVIPWKRADLDRLPDDGNRYEVLNGELLVTPAPSDVHQAIVDWLSAVLTPFVVAHRLGVVQHPRSVIVIDGSQVEPDLMARPSAPPLGWERAPIPFLVVEVLSRSTRQRDLGKKRAFYIKEGVAEYWVVDRQTRSILRVTPERDERVVGMLTWTLPNAAAALEVDVARMFRDVLGHR
jgi:Uma2 family endonuclease